MSEILRDVIARSRAGEAVAIPSVCSAHEDVLAAALTLAEALDRPIVVEATSNQVNQDGGYTGMQPADFIARVRAIAAAEGVDPGRIIFGGDHLGPQAWRTQSPAEAIEKARALMAAYVAAGFTKIHIDCSEGCAGEPAQLSDATTSERSAALAAVCEAAAPQPDALVYVIGTEVPPPGGARLDEAGDIAPTDPAAARATLDAHRAAFRAAGQDAALARVGALVVQPGVEFSPMRVHHLPLARDPGLLAATEGWDICLEAHSTDYQRPAAYRRLAELGFGFQKVGPALTFAWRQAVYALDALRMLAGWGEPLVLPAVERAMLAEPRYWQGHYRGDAATQRLMRHFALADRIRYYWPTQDARRAVHALFDDVEGRSLPEPLLLQCFDIATLDTVSGEPTAKTLVRASVERALRPYFS